MRRKLWRLGILGLVAVGLLLQGCGGFTGFKNWVTGSRGEEETPEESVPPEAKQEEVLVDGKPYVRSKNPYWLSYPDQPEYIYVPKGTEFKPFQQRLVDAVAKAMGRREPKAAPGVPPEKVQEMVRAEVERILREQGLGGYVSRGKGEKAPYSGRAAAVVPNPATPRNYEGLNRTLATSLGDALGRTKDYKVMTQERVREALGKAGVVGKITFSKNLQALGDYLGVQAVVVTDVIPPDKGTQGFLAAEVYDTFLGTKAGSVIAPAGSEGLRPEAVSGFVRDSSMKVASELANVDWFGRVEFIKEGKVYLSLGQNAGLKAGDRLKVVAPGKEVVNPETKASLGYTADEPKGEVKVTELLGDSGAVAQTLSGGPFKANEKVKAAR